MARFLYGRIALRQRFGKRSRAAVPACTANLVVGSSIGGVVAMDLPAA